MFKKLIEDRANFKAQLEELLKSAKTENRALNDEEIKKFGEIEGSIKAIDATIAAEDRARGIADIEKNHNEDEKEQIKKEERAFVDFIFNGSSMENRANNTLTQGNNGAIVPKTIAKRIITKAKDVCPFLQLSNVCETNGDLSVPVYGDDGEDHITAGYVDENTDLTDNVGKFTSIDLKGFVVGALSHVSNKLKNNTDVDVLGFIENEIGEAIGEVIEGEFINGTEKIKGVLTTEKIILAGASNAITFDELVKLKHSVKKRFRKNGKWIMNPETYTAVCELKDQNGQPYFKEDDYKVLGCEVIESDNMPKIAASAKAVVFGDLSGYSIKAPKKIEVSVLREKFATKNMTGVLGLGEYDGAITNKQKIAALQMGA